MRYKSVISVLALLVAIFAGSHFQVVGDVSAQMKADMPGPDGKALYEYITAKSPYEGWKLWPGKGKYYKGREPHGALLTTYVNDTAFRDIEARYGMSDGAIIVKENYTPDRNLAAVTVVYRIKGYNPDGGDWFWLKYAPGGDIQAEGKVKGCINCHMRASNNDFIYTGKIR